MPQWVRLSEWLGVILDCTLNVRIPPMPAVCHITTITQFVRYPITRSARASKAGGIAMPMALAVLTLITNSYLVG